MKLVLNMHYGFYPLTIFVKSSFINVSQGPKYVSQSHLFIWISLIHGLQRKLFSRNLISPCGWNIWNNASFLQSPTNCSKTTPRNAIRIYTVQKKKFSTKNFFRKCDQSLQCHISRNKGDLREYWYSLTL